MLVGPGLQSKSGDCCFFQVGWVRTTGKTRSVSDFAQKLWTWKTLSSSAEGLRSIQWAVKRKFFIETFRLNLRKKLKIDATNQRWEENREKKKKEWTNAPQRKCEMGYHPSYLWELGKVIWLTVFSYENLCLDLCTFSLMPLENGDTQVWGR